MPEIPHPEYPLPRRLECLWQLGQRPDVHEFLAGAGVRDPAVLAEVLAVDQWRRWHAGEPVPAEEYLRRYPALAANPETVLELVYGEWLVREELGQRPDPEEYFRRFPQWADRLRHQLDLHRALASGSSRRPTFALSGTVPWQSQADNPAAVPSPGGPLPAVPGYEIEVFAARPEWASPLRGDHRYNAARSAVLAASGRGDGAAKRDPEARARWRSQALDWLRADLAVWTTQADAKTPKERERVQRELRHWRGNPDLASVRGAEALAALPEAERAGWRALWREVDALLTRTRGKQEAEPASGGA
jgi:hypothetical protein